MKRSGNEGPPPLMKQSRRDDFIIYGPPRPRFPPPPPFPPRNYGPYGGPFDPYEDPFYGSFDAPYRRRMPFGDRPLYGRAPRDSKDGASSSQSDEKDGKQDEAESEGGPELSDRDKASAAADAQSARAAKYAAVIEQYQAAQGKKKFVISASPSEGSTSTSSSRIVFGQSVSRPSMAETVGWAFSREMDSRSNVHKSGSKDDDMEVDNDGQSKSSKTAGGESRIVFHQKATEQDTDLPNIQFMSGAQSQRDASSDESDGSDDDEPDDFSNCRSCRVLVEDVPKLSTTQAGIKDKSATPVYYWDEKTGNYTLIDVPNNQRVKQVACSKSHHAAVTDNGMLLFWELKPVSGKIVSSQQLTPKFAKGLSESIKQVVCGDGFVVCLTDKGFVMTFGKGKAGCLGHGVMDSLTQPKVIAGLSKYKVAHISCGPNHVLAITEKHEVLAWGRGSLGKFGLSSSASHTKPQLLQVDPLLKAQRAYCGDDCAVIVTKDHRVLFAGAKQLKHEAHSQKSKFSLIKGTPFEELVKTAAVGADHIAIVTTDGKCWCLGFDQGGSSASSADKGLRLMVAYNAVDVVCSDTSTLCLSDDGDVFTWENTGTSNVVIPGRMALPVTGSGLVASISCAERHALIAFKSAGDTDQEMQTNGASAGTLTKENTSESETSNKKLRSLLAPKFHEMKIILRAKGSIPPQELISFMSGVFRKAGVKHSVETETVFVSEIEADINGAKLNLCCLSIEDVPFIVVESSSHKKLRNRAYEEAAKLMCEKSKDDLCNVRCETLEQKIEDMGAHKCASADLTMKEKFKKLKEVVLAVFQNSNTLAEPGQTLNTVLDYVTHLKHQFKFEKITFPGPDFNKVRVILFLEGTPIAFAMGDGRKVTKRACCMYALNSIVNKSIEELMSGLNLDDLLPQFTNRAITTGRVPADYIKSLSMEKRLNAVAECMKKKATTRRLYQSLINAGLTTNYVFKKNEMGGVYCKLYLENMMLSSAYGCFADHARDKCKKMVIDMLLSKPITELMTSANVVSGDFKDDVGIRVISIQSKGETNLNALLSIGAEAIDVEGSKSLVIVKPSHSKASSAQKILCRSATRCCLLMRWFVSDAKEPPYRGTVIVDAIEVGHGEAETKTLCLQKAFTEALSSSYQTQPVLQFVPLDESHVKKSAISLDRLIERARHQANVTHNTIKQKLGPPELWGANHFKNIVESKKSATKGSEIPSDDGATLRWIPCDGDDSDDEISQIPHVEMQTNPNVIMAGLLLVDNFLKTDQSSYIILGPNIPPEYLRPIVTYKTAQTCFRRQNIKGRQYIIVYHRVHPLKMVESAKEGKGNILYRLVKKSELPTSVEPMSTSQ